MPLRSTEYDTSHYVNYAGFIIPGILANKLFDHLTTKGGGQEQLFHHHCAEVLSCIVTILLYIPSKAERNNRTMTHLLTAQR